MKLLLLLIVFAAFSIVTFGQAANPATLHGGNKPPAPAFSVTSLDGEKFELAALRGKVVVLNFWFTGCVPCVAEFNKLNGLVDKFKGKEVVFLALTLDSASILGPFLKRHPFKYNIVPNANRLIVSTYSDGSGDVVFPTHIVIDKQGKIDTRVAGAKTVDDLQKAIVRLLSAEAADPKNPADRAEATREDFNP